MYVKINYIILEREKIMKKFLSLTLIAIMLLSTLALTSCATVPKGMHGGVYDILHNIACGVLSKYEINEAQWKENMAQMNYCVQWNNVKSIPELTAIRTFVVDQTNTSRCENLGITPAMGEVSTILYSDIDGRIYKFVSICDSEYVNGTWTERHECQGYVTKSPFRTLAEEVFLEDVKFEDLEYDGAGRYYYRTTLFGKDVEYVFEFRFGHLYEMRMSGLGYVTATYVGVNSFYNWSLSEPLNNTQLD